MERIQSESETPADATGATVDPRRPTDALRSQLRITMLTRVLRAIGALVVAASAGTFLFQRWEQGTDLHRYFALLAQAGVLSGVGFFCAVRLAESRSARTFQALAVGMLPELFAILGGLVYSQFTLDGPLVQVAGYATWKAPSGFAALATTGATVVVALPVALLAFLSLARSEARALTVAFVAANAALLAPTRHPVATAAIVATGFAGLAWLELRRFQGATAMRTREGLMVRGLLILPLALVIARSLVHYELSLYMASILSFGIAGLLFAFGRARPEVAAAAPFELGTLAPVAIGCLTFAAATVDSFALHEGVFLPLCALPFGLSATVLSLFVRREVAPYTRTIAIVTPLLALGANLFVGVGVLPMFLALVTGIAGVAYGFLFASRGVMALGAVVGASALVGHVLEAIDLYAHFNWGSLSLLGIAVILGASALDRHHAAIGQSLRQLRTRVRGEELA